MSRLRVVITYAKIYTDNSLPARYDSAQQGRGTQ